MGEPEKQVKGNQKTRSLWKQKKCLCQLMAHPLLSQKYSLGKRTRYPELAMEAADSCAKYAKKATTAKLS